MKLKSIGLLGLCICIAVLLNTRTSAQQKAKENNTTVQDALKLNVVYIGNSKLLRVSHAESGPGKTGRIKVLDAAGNLSLQSDIELLASPFYSTVELTQLTPGSYTVVLITDAKIYDSKLDLK